VSAQSQPENGKSVRLDPEVLAAEFRALARLREHWLDKKRGCGALRVLDALD
jgi:hypothetical protein